MEGERNDGRSRRDTAVMAFLVVLLLFGMYSHFAIRCGGHVEEGSLVEGLDSAAASIVPEQALLYADSLRTALGLEGGEEHE